LALFATLAIRFQRVLVSTVSRDLSAMIPQTIDHALPIEQGLHGSNVALLAPLWIQFV
jgi:hypothetical protein